MKYELTRTYLMEQGHSESEALRMVEVMSAICERRRKIVNAVMKSAESAGTVSVEGHFVITTDMDVRKWIEELRELKDEYNRIIHEEHQDSEGGQGISGEEE